MKEPLQQALHAARREIVMLTAEKRSWRRERRALERSLCICELDRRMFAYEIHDGLAQYLAAAIMQLHAFGHLTYPNFDDAPIEYNAAIKALRECHREVRRLINGMRPIVLDDLGIVGAVQALIEEIDRESGLKIDFHFPNCLEKPPVQLENVLYRIIQESLTNVRRHSRSNRAQIDLLQSAQSLHLEIQDWGIGFDREK